MTEDTELLLDFVEQGSEAAFSELVRRRIDLVYSVARRHVGNDIHLAEDVTQSVFVDLARKAPTLVRHVALTGWLYRSAQFAATSRARGERRRRAPETEADLMKQHPDDPAPEWEQLRPMLDQALNTLNEQDRSAVALRFFEARSFAEIGRTLRLTEDTARKRVDRALERLHAVLNNQGVASTTAAVAALLASPASFAAPPGLAATVTGAALASGGASGAMGTIFVMNKLQTSVAAVAAIAGVTAFLVQFPEQQRLATEIEALRLQESQIAALRSETEKLAALASEVEDRKQDDIELTLLRDETEALRRRQAALARRETQDRQTRVDVGSVPTFDLQQLNDVPQPRFRIPPTYPADMRRGRISGEVLVDFVVDANGQIQDARARKYSRPEFAGPAVEAVRQWEFKPGERDQSRVNTRMQVPVVFTMVEADVDPMAPPFEPVYPKETGLRAFSVQASAPKPRQMRQLRVERMAQGWTQSLRRWLRERLGVKRTEAQRMTARESVAQTQREAPRQSRGIRM